MAKYFPASGVLLDVMRSQKWSKKTLLLQNRDYSILRGLFESRVMTTAHISAIYFEGRYEAAKKGLQKLKASNYITERPRRVSDPALLLLARPGLTALRERGILQEYPFSHRRNVERRTSVSQVTLQHELDVMDVKAAFFAAFSNNPRFEITEFTTWPLLNQFVTAGVTTKPDGFIRIQESIDAGFSVEHTFFLELDRSTEVQETLVTRAAAYLNHYKSGDFAVRNGASRSEYKKHAFRALYVFKTEERRNNTGERLLQLVPPILTHVWLSTKGQATQDPFGAIWFTPADYKNAVEGTQFDHRRARNVPLYKRQSLRDDFINNKIIKRRLLSD